MCLSDRTLWALSEGEGTAADRDHLRRCPLCAGRARGLGDDLAMLGRILHELPPRPAPVAPATVRLRWAIAGAALAAALGGVWLAGPSRTPHVAAAPANGVDDLAALSTALFAEDARADVSPSGDDDVLVAAFDAAAPCEWQPGGCEDDFDPSS